MSRSALAARAGAVALALAASASLTLVAPAHAASQRTFVRSDGADTGTCSLALPCRSFNYAIGQTNSGGEVVILDTAGYGPMTINKAIKIIGPSGVYGGISVLGAGINPTTGIVINAGDSDDVILRGLDITGVPTVAPLPLIGIDIQNAGAVHIEKSSISNFPEDGGACIQMITTKTVRLYVDDSFLRHCVTGIFLNGGFVSSSRSSVIVDNTRIERGFNANPATASIGVQMSGFLAVTLRNTVISRQTTAVRFDSNLASANNTLDIVNSTFGNNTNGLSFAATADGATSQIRIVGSQITNTTNDAIGIVNSAIGRNTFLAIGESVIANAGRGLALTNNSTDTANARIVADLDNTRMTNAANTGVTIDLNAPNGAKTSALIRDSTFASAGTLLKTRGTSQVSASLVRSLVNNCNIVVDHGVGTVRIESNHLVACSDDFVNNGSSGIVSDGHNVVDGIANASGFVYIVPGSVTVK
jgi:hypothetical protein